MPDPSGDARTEVIYHLLPESQLQSGMADDYYSPARLSEDGFVHCASGVTTTLSVAADYFASLRESLLVMEIDTRRLTHELRFEAAAPIEGGGTAHLRTAESFPHIYGAIDLAAIRGVASLGDGGGPYRWPERFDSLASLLESRAKGQ